MSRTLHPQRIIYTFWFLSFKVIQDHQLLHKSKAHIYFPVSDCDISSISHSFRDIELHIYNHPPYFEPQTNGTLRNARQTCAKTQV